jgi:hypothetical protein
MVWFQAGYWIVSAAAIAIGLLLCMQTLEHRRYARSRGRRVCPKAPLERVALFVPCKGAEEDLQANLRPMFEQDHADYELVLIVESVDDKAYEPIRRLISQHPEQRAKLVVAGLATTSGQKVHNLLVATENLDPEVRVLAFADADIRPPRDWLRLLTQQLHASAASTGYRRFVPKRATLANLLVASIDSSVIPIMFPSIHHKVWGGSWAIRRETFVEGGIRQAWQGTLSDDLVAANVLARTKQSLALETSCILPSSIDVDLRGMLSWVRRQFIIGRFYSPFLWSVVFVGHLLGQAVFWGSLVAALIGWSTGRDWAWQPTVAVAALFSLQVLRGWLRQDASRYYLPDMQPELAAVRRFDTWCGPLTGLALACALLGSAIGRRIVWKQNVYEMRYGGQIRKIPAAGQPAAAAEPLEGPSRRAA